MVAAEARAQAQRAAELNRRAMMGLAMGRVGGGLRSGRPGLDWSWGLLALIHGMLGLTQSGQRWR